MVDFKEDERLNTLNHSCAHVMAQAVKHLYPNAKFWVGPVVKEGFYYDIDLGDTAVNDDVIAAIEKEMKKVLSGMRPTGKLHIGHLSVIENWVKLQEKYETNFFIADYHALTTQFDDTAMLQKNIRKL